MYDKATSEFVLFAKGLKQLATVGEIFHSTREDLYTVVTWLDDNGNEYLPSYNPDGTNKPLNECTPVPQPAQWSSELDENSLGLVEHEGKYYFKDEADVGNYNLPVYL